MSAALSIRPEPSPRELAAIVAALELARPRPAAPALPADAAEATRWRFSGRWWVRPLPMRRDRPH